MSGNGQFGVKTHAGGCGFELDLALREFAGRGTGAVRWEYRYVLTV